MQSIGPITITVDYGEPGITLYELNGFATPDARLLVLEGTLTTEADGGTGQEGSIGTTYAICTNCD